MSNSGVYVPPHLRNRPTTTTTTEAGPSRIQPLQTERNASAGPSRETYSSPSRRNYRGESPSYLRPTHPSDNYDASSPTKPSYSNSAPSPGPRSAQRSNGSGYSASPTLYVFGDSFTGPLKLLSEDCVKVTTFKGSSAKGLNNPNSIKQVSRELLPALNSVMAPPAYAYIPSAGRWALLIFGNVDLQINYLWQLQHKPISHLSFPSSNDADEDETMDEFPHAFDPNVLASATETTLRGPALGPDLFVEKAIKGYTAWLDREIVNGPSGQRLQERADDTTAYRRKPPGKIMIAGALPPLVDNETLPRIPEKYVDRLEEDHTKTQQALERDDKFAPDRLDKPVSERVSKTPWARKSEDSEDAVGLSTATMSDETVEVRPSSPKSATSSTWSSGFDSALSSSAQTALTSPSSPSRKSESEHVRVTIQELLKHDPPLCDRQTRVYMTKKFNQLLSDYCSKYPDILAFVDITEGMLSGNSNPTDISEEENVLGQADRGTWACPVDPTNIHPLWEPTLPLWLAEMGKQGVPIAGYKITEDAEETFKAYEQDKRRRTANRIKIRDE